ncbi:patatin-like phospholipase family protein [Chloroflexota bacterium]
MALERHKKIGLALGGGAARGLAHVGVLEVLQKEGIPIDVIAGTSTGALVGALYARDKDVGQIKKLAGDMNRTRLASLVDVALPKSGFIRGRKIKELLKTIIGDVKFEDLRIPLSCVATDIMTGEAVIINQGSVLEAVRASISIPVIFAVAKVQGRYLVDGELINPVPADVARQMGADFVIAVNVIPSVEERVHREKSKKTGLMEPGMFNVIAQSIYIASYAHVKSYLEAGDVLIEPQVAHIGLGDFHRAQECFRLGEAAALGFIPEIRRKMEGWTS